LISEKQTIRKGGTQSLWPKSFLQEKDKAAGLPQFFFGTGFVISNEIGLNANVSRYTKQAIHTLPPAPSQDELSKKLQYPKAHHCNRTSRLRRVGAFT
jgi:hypothetical protein